MTISGFTYIRNGFTYGYPFIPSIQSLLPMVDELVVVVGDSHDGTREAIVALNDPKIKIVDTVWDETMRTGGKIFASQANLGLDHVSGDWAFHLQADEVFHQDSAARILEQLRQIDRDPTVEGILFPFLHFWGDFRHIRNTRRTHKYEVRIFRNTGTVRSYKDSQGFRKYGSLASYTAGEKGQKLRVLLVNEPIFHYSYARNPRLMMKKSTYFSRFWHSDAELQQNQREVPIDYNEVDRLENFSGEHPVYMQEVIRQQDWSFTYDPSRSNMRFKDKILNWIDRKFNRRPFSYRNYKLVKGR